MWFERIVCKKAFSIKIEISFVLWLQLNSWNKSCLVYFYTSILLFMSISTSTKLFCLTNKFLGMKLSQPDSTLLKSKLGAMKYLIEPQPPVHQTVIRNKQQEVIKTVRSQIWVFKIIQRVELKSTRIRNKDSGHTLLWPI